MTSKMADVRHRADKRHQADVDDTIALADRLLREIPRMGDRNIDTALRVDGGDTEPCGSINDANSQSRITIHDISRTSSDPRTVQRTPQERDAKVLLNVGGKLFATYHSTLARLPGTRLSALDERDPSFDAESREYFFDRNPAFFAAVLDLYRTGELHFAHCLCGPSIRKELAFWGVKDSHISNCCWRSYKSYEAEEETMATLDSTLTDATPPSGLGRHYCAHQDGRHSGYCEARRRLWDFLDSPQSSRPAQLWAALIITLILVSITLVCLETHPAFRVPRPNLNASKLAQLNITNAKQLLYEQTVEHAVLKYIDYVCTAVFLVEVIARFAACPSKLDFLRSVFNIIDLFCVLPMAAIAVLRLAEQHPSNVSQTRLLSATTSVLRVFRLLKVAKHQHGMQILLLAFRSSVQELLLLVMLMIMGMLIFSTLIYFCEFESAGSFMNIPIGFWWSMITMTTVGYGDVYPVTGGGYVIGVCCAIAGLMFTGLPIPIIASNFNHYYAFSRYRKKLLAKRASETFGHSASLAKELMVASQTESPALIPPGSRHLGCRVAPHVQSQA